MSRFEKKVVVDVKLMKEAMTWLDAQLNLFEDPALMEKMGFFNKQKLKINKKSLKKTIKKFKEAME